MSTFTANATQLKFVRSAGSSSWENGRGAYQGRYTGGSPRVGAMYFPTLLSIPWDQQIISSIKLRFTFAQAGGDFVTGKTLGLYRGAKTGGISGTGTSMRGASLGGVGFYRGWGSTQTATLSASGNAGVFGNFVAWLQQAPSGVIPLQLVGTAHRQSLRWLVFQKMWKRCTLARRVYLKAVRRGHMLLI